MTKRHDQLIEDALVLLKDAVRVEPFQTQNTLPPAQSSWTETNVVVTTHHPDGYTSVVAASSVEVVSIDGAEQPKAAPPVEHQGEDASSSQETEHPHADLVEHTLAIMRTSEEKSALVPSEGLPAKLPSSKSWLDTERANFHRRVENFRATQNRFQHDRAEYCDAALAAAVAGEWKPSSQQ